MGFCCIIGGDATSSTLPSVCEMAMSLLQFPHLCSMLLPTPIMYAQGVRHMQNRQQRIAVRLGVSGVSTLAWSWLRDGGTYWVVFPRHLLGEMRR
jgi:hypothetical protein